MRYRYEFEDKVATPMTKLFSSTAFEIRDMSNYTLTKVRREDNIKVERVSGGQIIISRGQ